MRGYKVPDTSSSDAAMAQFKEEIMVQKRKEEYENFLRYLFLLHFHYSLLFLTENRWLSKKPERSENNTGFKHLSRMFVYKSINLVVS